LVSIATHGLSLVLFGLHAEITVCWKDITAKIAAGGAGEARQTHGVTVWLTDTVADYSTPPMRKMTSKFQSLIALNNTLNYQRNKK